MDTATAAHANNLFPTAQGDAPDLKEEKTVQSSPSTGFPAAPILKGGSVAAEIVHLAAEQTVRTGTKVDQAIAYLATCPNETAKRDDLAAFMGIKPTDIVAYLRSAINGGRITRDGNLFSVGVEPEARTEKRAPATVQKGRPQPLPKPKEPVAKAAPVADDAPAAAKPAYLPIATMSVSNFSVAVWPDGAMQVHTGGATLELSAMQMGVLKMFLELVESSGPNHG